MALAVFRNSDSFGLILHIESGSGGSVWVSPKHMLSFTEYYSASYCPHYKVIINNE